MKCSRFAVYAAGLLLLLITAPAAIPQGSNASYKLEVHVKYTGAGTVDEQHKIYVVLWDSADFASGGNEIPVAIESTSSKVGTVKFDNITKTPAYISTVYDQTGHWDAQSAPPEGSSLGLYSNGSGAPAPIALQAGKTTTVDVTFDDRVKMKSGTPSR
jgi:hypothetical protein